MLLAINLFSIYVGANSSLLTAALDIFWRIEGGIVYRIEGE